MSDLRKAAQQALRVLKLAQTEVHWELNSATRQLFRLAEKDLSTALAGKQSEYSAGWDASWDCATRIERETCARIVERNAQSCANNSMLQDVLNGNAAAIRARNHTNEQ